MVLKFEEIAKVLLNDLDLLVKLRTPINAQIIKI